MRYIKPKKRTIIFILRVCLGAFLCGCTTFTAEKKPPEPERMIQQRIQDPSWDTENLTPNHLSLAEELMAKGFYEVARVQLDLVLKEKPGNKNALALRGVCARETGNLYEAETDLKKSIEADKNFAYAHNHLAVLYAMEERFDLAEDSIKKALAIDPARADFFNNAGMIALEKEDWEAAKQNFTKALKIEPNHEKSVNNLALTLGYLKEYERALTLLLEHGSLPMACHNMGYIYDLAGEKKMAEKMYRMAEAKGSGPSPEYERLFGAQVLNPDGPDNPAPPSGMPGDIGAILYEAYKSKLNSK